MRRLRRDPLRFDVFDAFAVHGREQRVSLRHDQAKESFIGSVRASIDEALRNNAFLHGQRTQAMFEALVASLGEVLLLKQEDAGEAFAADDGMEVPDFRIVLADRSQILTEVKNFYQGEHPNTPFELTDSYLGGLLRYAELMRCRLGIAVYWVGWNLWTLVPPSAFRKQDNKWLINLPEALQANEMALLGDKAIGTNFPLSLVVFADKTKPRSIGPDGQVTFTISGLEMYCAGRKIQEELDTEIATYLMFYGSWPEQEPKAHATGNELDALEFSCAPPEDQGQGFEIAGWLSSMFSRFYGGATAKEGAIDGIRAEVSPGFLGRLIPEGYTGKDLPLWVLILKPSLPARGLATSP